MILISNDLFFAKNLLDLNQTITAPLFQKVTYAWEVLPLIGEAIIELASHLPGDFEEIAENVWAGKGTTIERTVLMKGPAIIGYDCEIRHAAFVRENAIIGDEVVVGNSTEIKNAVLFNGVQVPHFNYVGDSVLGFEAHLGAGVISSNFKSTKDNIKLKGSDGTNIDTGLRKFGALIGDRVEVGCNAVLNPGTIIGKESIIYPLSSVRGIIPAQIILKSDGRMVHKR